MLNYRNNHEDIKSFNKVHLLVYLLEFADIQLQNQCWMSMLANIKYSKQSSIN